jgi:hypothetical protein
MLCMYVCYVFVDPDPNIDLFAEAVLYTCMYMCMYACMYVYFGRSRFQREHSALGQGLFSMYVCMYVCICIDKKVNLALFTQNMM